jgi:malonyl-CoA O-methyltransferase
MKSETYKEVKEKLEKLKRGIPYLETKIKTRNKKEIEDSIGYLIYILHRIHKKVTGMKSGESIDKFSKILWWFKKRDERDKRKFVRVNKLYSEWAKDYDTEANLVVFLESEVFNSFIGKVKDKSILDYGCGTGRYTIPLAKKGADIEGIDFTKAMLDLAKKKSKSKKLKIKFTQQDIQKYKPNRKFDIIISMLVLDHIKNLNKVIEIIDKASNIGTKVIISGVHPGLLMKDVDPKTGKTQGWLVEGKKTDQYYHPTSEYVELFEKRGFYLTKIKDLGFEKKYQNKRKFKKFGFLKNKAVGIIMRFEKLK